MEDDSYTPLSLLDSGFVAKPICVTIGRVIIRQCLHVCGYPHHTMKSVATVEFFLGTNRYRFLLLALRDVFLSGRILFLLTLSLFRVCIGYSHARYRSHPRWNGVITLYSQGTPIV